MLIGTRLKDNFENDNYFQHSDTLYIIDDYNIMGMKKEGNGYIVDGSLNTFGKGRIFAQLMDKENFDLLRDFFYDKIKASELGIEICLYELTRFKNTLNRFL